MSNEALWEECGELRLRDNQLLRWLNDARQEIRELRETVNNLSQTIVEVQRSLRPAGWWEMIDLDAPEEEDDAIGYDGYDDDALPGAQRILVEVSDHGE